VKKHIAPTQLVVLASALYAAYFREKPLTSLHVSDSRVLLTLKATNLPEVSFFTNKGTWEEQSEELQEKLAEEVGKWEERFTTHVDDVNAAREVAGLPSRSALARRAPSCTAMTDPTQFVAVRSTAILRGGVPWPSAYRKSLRSSSWRLVPANHPALGTFYSRDVAEVSVSSLQGVLLHPCLFQVTTVEARIGDALGKLEELGLRYYNAGSVLGSANTYEIFPNQKGHQDPNKCRAELLASNLFATVTAVEKAFPQ
jgi:hypothetical protein